MNDYYNCVQKEFVKTAKNISMKKTLNLKKMVPLFLCGLAIFVTTLLISFKINRVLDTKYLTPSEFAQKHK